MTDTQARAALRVEACPMCGRRPNAHLRDYMARLRSSEANLEAGGGTLYEVRLALPDDGREHETYARHPFRVGGYLTDPAPDNRCVWRVDGTSPYCGIPSADHDDVLARRRSGTWHWAALPDDSREGMDVERLLTPADEAGTGPHNDINPSECLCADCQCDHEIVERARLGFVVWSCPNCGDNFTLTPLDL